jgi:epidermal growth factor receptor substrate 15
VASSPPLRDQSADIGNVQIQLGSTNRALETVKNERADIERTLAEQAAQLSTLQSQLTSAKTAYETETHLLETLRERYATQNTEINKSRQELITAESDLSAMRVEKNEVQGNLLRDKEEVRELQKKMALAGAEIDTLKVEIEKAKKDAKQQKGLLAIARKQLASRETEKFKVEKELQEAHTELGAATKEREDADAELVKEVPSNLTNGHSIEKPSSPDILSAAIAQPLPTTPDAIPSSPASIKGKSTNPFDRLTASGTPRSGSPFLPFATSDGSGPAVSAFAGASTDDPFGFSNPLPNVDEPEFPTVGTTSNGADDTTPSAPHVEPENFVVETRAAPTSAMDNDDLFSTPPSSAVDRTSSFDRITGGLTGNSTTSYTGLDATAATQFPELSSPHPPGHFPEVHSAHETDINSVLKELEVDESDTSDEESDEAVAHKAATQAVSSDTFDAAPAKLSTFDDTFGFSSGPVAPALSSSAKNVESTPVIPSELQAPTDLALSTRTVLAPNGLASETAAGKNAFDEAMGTIPGGHAAPATDAPFSFDTAFDDNFDFAAAKAETEKPLFPPPKSSTTNGVIASTPTMGFDSAFGLQPASSVVSPSTAAPNKSLSFDDTFSTGASNVQSSSNPSTSGSDSHAITFDSAFVGRRLSKALAFDDAFSVPKDPPAQQTPFPVASPPTSPESAAPSGSIPSSPPATFRRSASPSPELVPRHPASKSRSSTGNSDKLKEPPPRHSRLSVSSFLRRSFVMVESYKCCICRYVCRLERKGNMITLLLFLVHRPFRHRWKTQPLMTTWTL